MAFPIGNVHHPYNSVGPVPHCQHIVWITVLLQNTGIELHVGM